MANASVVVKIRAAVTPDFVTGLAFVSVLWPSPFYDTNYVISACVEVQGSLDPTHFAVAGVENVTPVGCTIIVNCSVPGTVVLHLIANHI